MRCAHSWHPSHADFRLSDFCYRVLGTSGASSSLYAREFGGVRSIAAPAPCLCARSLDPPAVPGQQLREMTDKDHRRVA